MMNKISKIMCVACTATLMTSCLDTVILPDDITVGEDFWKKKSDVALMVNAAYEGMTTEGIIESLIVWGDARSDEFVRAESPEGAIPNALAELMSVSTQVTNQYTNWSHFYSVINKCNIVLEKASLVLEEDPNYTEGDYLTDRSQMLALRSLCYFYLVRNFRDVPYVNYPFMDSSQERNFKQESPAVVLQKCIESLEEAAANAIQARSYNNWRRVGWFTQDGIHSLLADIYLWRASVLHNAGDYQKAAQYCDLVIESKKAQHMKGHGEAIDQEYPLASAIQAYEDLFGEEQNAEESIFELQIRNNSALCKYLYKYKDNNSTEGFLKASSIFTSGSTVATITNAVDEKVFPQNDIRYYNSIFSSREGAETFDVRKMISNQPRYSLTQDNRTPARTFANFNQNYIVYRLSDVMLMKAEALVQLVDTTGLSALDATAKAERQSAIDAELKVAFDLVAAVNTRSLLDANKGDAITWAKLNTMGRTGKSGLEVLILEERLRELCFEGKRWYDLLRFNYRHVEGVNYNESLGNQGLEALQPNYKTMLEYATRGKGNQAAGLQAKMRNEAFLYLPLPNSDVLLSPEMKQNPAYGSNNQFERN